MLNPRTVQKGAKLLAQTGQALGEIITLYYMIKGLRGDYGKNQIPRKRRKRRYWD